MLAYLLFRLGYILAMTFPLKVSYSVARFLADIHYIIYKKERDAIIRNLDTILGASGVQKNKEREIIARDVFRNFAKYLIDFFRFSKIDAAYIKNSVKIIGLSNLEEALKECKGVILLSAHLGNWELGGCIIGKLGYPISAVALTHKNRKVNDFFINQRIIGNVKSIEIGASLRSCYRVLKNNGLLALLGDRNFSATGLSTEFFGRKACMPKGPAVLSIRTGALIVPIFITRERDDTFKMVIEKPIRPPASGENEDSVTESLMKRYLTSIENCIKQLPDQWYVFKDFWDDQ